MGKNACVHSFCKPELSTVKGPSPLPYGDDDHDGLLDSHEAELARRFAPVVVLHRDDAYRPASIDWLLERADLFDAPKTVLAGSAELGGSSRGLSKTVHSGSESPEDWTTYVHVFPREDGGINVQYWFFYPYSNGPLLFDHDTDWEHLTVQVDPSGNPVGAHLAQHEDDHPGRYYSWSELRKHEGNPVVYSARGTHATHADPSHVAWFESAGQCDDLERCEHPVWKTWEGGGLENLGERGAPLQLNRALLFSARWGRTGMIPGTSAPHGPLYHRGFCIDGVQGCLDQVGLRVAHLTAAVERCAGDSACP